MASPATASPLNSQGLWVPSQQAVAAWYFIDANRVR